MALKHPGRRRAGIMKVINHAPLQEVELLESISTLKNLVVRGISSG